MTSTAMNMNEKTQLFNLPRIDVFIPDKSEDSLEKQDFSKTRNYVIQGELLKFYLVVRTSELLADWEKRENLPQEKLDEKTRAQREEAEKMMWKVTAPTQKSILANLERMIGIKELKQRLFSMFLKLKLRVQFYPGNKPPTDAEMLKGKRPVHMLKVRPQKHIWTQFEYKLDENKNKVLLASTGNNVNINNVPPSIIEPPSSPPQISSPVTQQPVAVTVAPPPPDGTNKPTGPTRKLSQPTGLKQPGKDEKPVVKELPFVAKDRFWEKFPTTDNCFVLPNGDIVYTLESVIAIKEKYLNSLFTFNVTALPIDEIDETEIDKIVDPNYKSSVSLPRHINVCTKLVEPIWVEFDPKQADSTHHIACSVTNLHSEPITLHALQLRVKGAHLKDTIAAEFEKYYRVEMEEIHYPIRLETGEKYMFAVSITPLPLPASSSGTTTNNQEEDFHPVVILYWTFPSMIREAKTLTGFTKYFMTSKYEMPLPEPCKKNLIVTFNTYNNPIKKNSLFPIRVTISNLASYERDLVMEVPLYELDDLDNYQYIKRPEKPKVKPSRDDSDDSDDDDIRIPRPMPSGFGPSGSTDSSAYNSLLNTPGTAYSNTNSAAATPASTPKSPSLSSVGRKRSSRFKEMGHVRAPSLPEKLLSSSADALLLGPSSEVRESMIEAYREIDKKKASILCLDKVVDIGKMDPRSEISIDLQCIALQDGLFKIRDIKIFDRFSKYLYKVEQACEVYVI